MVLTILRTITITTGIVITGKERGEMVNNLLLQMNLDNTQTSKALRLIEEGKIRKTETGYTVIGSRGLTWEIIDGKCECEGFYFRGFCYHSKAAQMIENGILEEIVI